MGVTGNEDHAISLDDAAALTEAFRSTAGANSILAGYFGKTALSGLLAQDGCVGLRIYNAIKDGKLTFVLVGVNSEGEDLQDGDILEFALPCPPLCPPFGKLIGTGE